MSILRRATLVCSLIVSSLAALCLCLHASAQSLVQDRVVQALGNGSTIALPGTVNPMARAEYDIGRVSPSTPYSGVTMYFKPSAAQQAALDALVRQQQDPSSPLYRQWITPAQYASEFGLSAGDLARVSAWLAQQGFAVQRISNSRNAIVFSGTAAQLEAAFQTELHHYALNGVAHTANASPISVPSALAGVVLSVRGLSDFRPHPMHKVAKASAVKSNYDFGSGGSVQHFLAPGDFTTIYDVSPLYNAGYTGAGKTIVIVGQSAVATTDITHFQAAAGLTQKLPTLTLVPNTGSSVADDTSGDEDESDLDLEWSGAIATGATINFVYTGSNQNYGVFDAIQYAIDNDLGSIISNSYGACEPDITSSDVTTYETWFEQANSQGQTIVSAAGDDGATDCETTGTKGTVVDGDEATQGLAVDFPGSSPYVTSIGGTEFLADVSSPGSYWNSSSSNGSSAIQYIPEKVWNDTSTTNGPDAGGGGKSILFGKPSWQTGAGVPADGARDVPDISLNASPQHDGYLFCASGTGGTDADPSSCSNGFLDSSGDPTVAGGTSFGAPTFSGILAILNEKLNVNGLGNVNPEIYSLAATDYAGAFHDTTVGNNEIPCEIGSTGCTASPIGYAAATGYDLASGWGSIDATNFAGVFSTSVTTTATATTTALTSSPASPTTVGTAITLTATVTANTGSTTPTGAVQFTINGTAVGSAVTLSGGVATYSFTPTASGTDAVVATYTPSDSTAFSSSSATLSIVVNAAASYTLSATNVTVTQGSSGVSTVTVTANGFSGAVALTATAPTNLTNTCFTYTNPTATATGTVTVYTSESSCITAGARRVAAASNHAQASISAGAAAEISRLLGGAAFLSVMVMGFPARRRRRWPLWGILLLLGTCGVAMSGCGGSASSPTTPTTAAKGTYTITLTGTNSADNLSATTTFTLTID
jgi:subtilase family serine protease